MIEKRPLVTIAIPSYKPEFFEQSLRSAIGQTYDNIEINVSDNCPTEDIYKICKKYPMVNYQRNNNIGYKNVIDSIYSSNGEYIKPLFDDDLLHPFCVEYMVKSFQNNQDASLCFSARSIINTKNEITEMMIPFENNQIINGIYLKKLMSLNFKNLIGEFSTVMFKKNDINQLIKDEFFKYNNHDFSHGLADVIFFIKITDKSNAIYIKDTLSYFRRDEKLNSNSNPDFNKNLIFCVTDWIDLLIELHKNKEIEDIEITNSIEVASLTIQYWINRYPEIIKNYDELLEYVLNIYKLKEAGCTH